MRRPGSGLSLQEPLGSRCDREEMTDLITKMRPVLPYLVISDAGG